MILGKNMTTLGKSGAIFSKVGKVYHLNWDFSDNWECFRSLCLPPTGSGDILFFPVRLSVCPSVCPSQIVSAL